jgi:hypothetical protein
MMIRNRVYCAIEVSGLIPAFSSAVCLWVCLHSLQVQCLYVLCQSMRVPSFDDERSALCSVTPTNPEVSQDQNKVFRCIYLYIHTHIYTLILINLERVRVMRSSPTGMFSNEAFCFEIKRLIKLYWGKIDILLRCFDFLMIFHGQNYRSLPQ